MKNKYGGEGRGGLIERGACLLLERGDLLERGGGGSIEDLQVLINRWS